MIPNVPKPFPDELLHSILARYYWIVRAPSFARIARRLFGTHRGIMHIDFPKRLGLFHSQLPIADCHDPLDVVHNHTMLPLYSHFLAPERVTILQNALVDAKAYGTKLRSGSLSHKMPPARYLRYCPRCAEEERLRSGEAYWHRLHQVAGVQVCPFHRVFLQESIVPRSFAHVSEQFVAAEDIIQPMHLRQIDENNPDHLVLLRLATNSAWLLLNPSRGNDADSLTSRYTHYLVKAGYCGSKSQIRRSKIKSAIERRYSASLLNTLHCNLSYSTSSTWLGTVVKSQRHVTDPMRHLLLMDFLALTPEQFFATRETIRVQVCAPKCEENVFSGGDAASANQARKSQRIDPQKRRDQWIALRTEFPLASLSEMQRRSQSCYRALMREDRDWLREHSPPKKERTTHVDWGARDRLLAEGVEKARDEILSSPGPLERISAAAIARKIGAFPLIQKSIAKLPLTSAALLANTESILAFALRRIAWAASRMRDEGSRIMKTNLKLRSGVRRMDLSRNPNVIEAVQAEIGMGFVHSRKQVERSVS
jgi:hypothetical protein